jgi:hypothetical protein
LEDCLGKPCRKHDLSRSAFGVSLDRDSLDQRWTELESRKHLAMGLLLKALC